MESEYTRQTRWACPPEIVDPAQVPLGSTYVREIVWVPCTACDLQVHTCRFRMLADGILCPECGRQLATAAAAEEQSEAMGKVSEEESRFHQRLNS
jgi:hypothetical protein